ncbi:hypothetical protein BVY04_00205 [bacterium M21]|nr:hypothetical protein BVY04_00205 [bacterium M21]
MKRHAVVTIIGLIAFTAMPLFAETYYVSDKGQDSNLGTIDAPFRTIQKAANNLQAGDSCIVRGGTYRETVTLKNSGSTDQPIIIKAFAGEIPVITGLDVVTGSWRIYKNSIYKTQLKPGLTIEQLFVDRQPMTWARWPNAPFRDRWSATKWKETAKGSLLGKLIDPDLGKTGVDWTGAIVTLNTHPNWDKWTAIVENHAKGKDNFDYTDKLQWKEFVRRSGGRGSYYLSGKLAALDDPEEWFYDKEKGELYLYLPEGEVPDGHVVEIKTRDYGFYSDKCDYITIEGLHFFGTTFNFRECHHSTVENCHIRFPNVAPLLTDLNLPPSPTICTQMIGHHNTVRNSSLAYSPTQGLRMLGSYTLVENNLIHDINWVGSLCYCNIWMGNLADNYTWEGALKYEGMLDETVEQATEEELKNVKWGGATNNIVRAHDPDKAQAAGKCTVRNNTLFQNGNVVLGFFEQPDYDIGYNHVYGGGYFCSDVSSIYTTLPAVRGSKIHHNWIKTQYKLAVRADDQSRGVAVHHNVMWGAHKGMLVVKGDDNAVYHNTTLRPKSAKNWGLNVQTWPEPNKPHYRKLWPLLAEQNANTPIWNNLTHTITNLHTGRIYSADDPHLSHNLLAEDPDALLVNPAGMDFRPKKGSSLIDAARPIKGINDGFMGKAPDIGAYEYGAEYWVPGYRNFARTFDLEINQQTGKASLKVVLGMPPVKAASVIVREQPEKAKGLDSSKLEFTPENWSTPQTVTFNVLEPADAADYLFITVVPDVSVK